MALFGVWLLSPFLLWYIASFTVQLVRLIWVWARNTDMELMVVKLQLRCQLLQYTLINKHLKLKNWYDRQMIQRLRACLEARRERRWWCLRYWYPTGTNSAASLYRVILACSAWGMSLTPVNHF
jgi:hypothetical protein